MTARLRSRRDRWAIGIILLAGLALRLFRLGAGSLWYDETVSVYLAGSPIAELIRHTAGDIHPPGYYLLLRGWLLLTGYGDGRADPQTFGLEFVAAFFSLFFGVLLIALVYSLARKVAGQRVALVAAALVAFSPFNIWYSQEARMYTLGAALGLVAFRALLALIEGERARPAAIVYAVVAALGMYILYYFAFLLVPLNGWALVARLRRRQSIRTLLVANLAAAVLYAPWIPVAFRQATQPPVPPWRTAPNLFAAIVEGWTALSFGQSAPAAVWPALLLTLALYVVGLVFLARRSLTRATGLAVATFGPLLLILLVSLVTPLYHVRYLFTYSPAFYVALAAGVVALAQGLKPDRFASPRSGASVRFGVAILACVVWLAASALTLREFWFNPIYRADDHRAATRELAEQWRPGDVVLVNAGWPYTALATYWLGDIASRTRITEPLPEPRADAALMMITTGHTDGNPSLGWGDPRSDFFAMPSDTAKQQVAALFDRFRRVWHYRIYDTVNDPDGLIRGLLSEYGQLTGERTYPGEAFLRVESYAPVAGVAWDETLPGASFDSLNLRFQPLAGAVEAGEPAYATLIWQPTHALTTRIAVSLRLLGPDGELIYQPLDEQPLGPAFPSTQWPPEVAQPQTVAIAAPQGTPPGEYAVVLVVYDAETGRPLPFTPVNGAEAYEPGVRLGALTVTPPAHPPAPRPALADFGSVALIEASTPVTAIAPGGQIPVDLLWQSRAPADALVVVAQLLREDGSVAANLEEEPTRGRYPVSAWRIGELARNRHTLTLPADIAPGTYRLIVGVYRASDGKRLATRSGPFGSRDYYEIGMIDVR